MPTLDAIHRITVEPMSLGFRLGRQFRTFYEFSIASGQSNYVQLHCLCDFILQHQHLDVDSGSIRFAANINSTVGAAFTTNLPIIGKNRAPSHLIGSPYTSQMQLQNGGTFSGGTVVEVFRVVASGSSAHESTVSGTEENQRALPAGDYWLEFRNISNSTATGVWVIEWEELF